MKVESSTGIDTNSSEPLSPRQMYAFLNDLPEEALDGHFVWIVRDVGHQRDPMRVTTGVKVVWEREAPSAPPTSPGSRTDFVDPEGMR